MVRKIRAKTEEKIDETKVMNVLDGLQTIPHSVLPLIPDAKVVEQKAKPVKVVKVKTEPVEKKEQKQPKEQKEPKESKEQKQRAPNAWLEFLKGYRMKHPEKSYKECLQDGKSEYKSA